MAARKVSFVGCWSATSLEIGELLLEVGGGGGADGVVGRLHLGGGDEGQGEQPDEGCEDSGCFLHGVFSWGLTIVKSER